MTDKEIEDRAKELQSDHFIFVGKARLNDTTISGKAATDVWLFNKLAELQLKNEELQEEIKNCRRSGWDSVPFNGSSWQ